MAILLESRAKQAADKLERQHSAKLHADEAIIQDMEYTKKMDARETMEKAAKLKRTEEHRVQLHKQIDERERARYVLHTLYLFFELLFYTHAFFCSKKNVNGDIKNIIYKYNIQI